MEFSALERIGLPVSSTDSLLVLLQLFERFSFTLPLGSNYSTLDKNISIGESVWQKCYSPIALNPRSHTRRFQPVHSPIRSPSVASIASRFSAILTGRTLSAASSLNYYCFTCSTSTCGITRLNVRYHQTLPYPPCSWGSYA